VNVAVLASIVAIVACLVVVLRPRRRRGRHAVHIEAVEPDDAASPQLVVPFTASEGPSSVTNAVVAGIVIGAIGAAVTSPFVGLIGGVATILIALVPRLRIVVGIAAAACVAEAGIYTALHQLQLNVPANGAWPQSFATAAQWAWAGVVLLAGDGAAEVARRAQRRTERRSKDDTDSADSAIVNQVIGEA
jgi:hypothetical protein